MLSSLPDAIAIALAGSTVLISIGAIVWTCRRTEDWRMHYAVIACATLLAAPYSMYYELVLLVPALAFMLQRGAQSGWISWERESVAGLILLSLLVPGPTLQFGLSVSFLASAGAAFVVFRRMRFELAHPVARPQSLPHIAAN